MQRLLILIPLLSIFCFAAKAESISEIDTVGSATATVDVCEPPTRHNWNLNVPYRHLVATPVLPDSADILRHRKKNVWRAGAETVGFNIGLWAFDRYVLKGHYAYISWNTIRENFRHGFEWDDDHLHTNMFDHPYNGSIFFNAGRSNGFNFWQSELFAIGGSAMWEMFMEREYPSTNDIIATPVGGAALGEVFYRTSDLILDDRTSGGERFGREFAAFLIDPMKGINRLITGDAWKRRHTSGRRFGIPPISADFSIGARMLSLTGGDNGTRGGAVAEVRLEYGDRYTETTKAPYDYFSFLLEVQGIKSQPLLSRVEIMGRLLSKELIDKKNFNLNLGLYQHFDFFDSDTIRPERSVLYFPCSVPYKLGVPASAGVGAMLRFIPNRSMSVDGFLHLNGVFLAGILTDFYRDYHRNYNWGSGFSMKAGLNWALDDDRVSIHIADQLYRTYTWAGYSADSDWTLSPDGKPVNVQGNSSNSIFNHFEISANYRLSKRFYLTGGLDYFSRHTCYNDVKVTLDNALTYTPIVDSRQIGVHLMLTYKL